MTGVGSAAGTTELGFLRVELRSVNGRGMALKQRLCPECAGLEPLLEDRLRGRLARGTVTLAIDRTDADFGVLSDLESLKRVAEQARAAARAVGVSEDIGLRDLVALAGAMPRPAARTVEALPASVAELLDRALQQLLQRRRAEGASTVAVMTEHLDEVERRRAEVQGRAPAVVEGHRQRLLKRVNDHLATQGLHLEAGDIVREVAMFAERADISEELHRIGAHLTELGNSLSDGGEVGRRCEFLLQELLREVNTLGSKSPDIEISHSVVAMKSAVDKLKEQAANLE